MKIVPVDFGYTTGGGIGAQARKAVVFHYLTCARGLPRLGPLFLWT